MRIFTEQDFVRFDDYSTDRLMLHKSEALARISVLENLISEVNEIVTEKGSVDETSRGLLMSFEAEIDKKSEFVDFLTQLIEFRERTESPSARVSVSISYEQ